MMVHVWCIVNLPHWQIFPLYLTSAKQPFSSFIKDTTSNGTDALLQIGCARIRKLHQLQNDEDYITLQCPITCGALVRGFNQLHLFEAHISCHAECCTGRTALVNDINMDQFPQQLLREGNII